MRVRHVAGALALMLGAVVVLAGCKGDDIQALAKREGLVGRYANFQGLAAVSTGQTVQLYDTTGTSPILIDQATLSDAVVDYPCCVWNSGTGTFDSPWQTDPEFSIFGMVWHPTRPWLYVFSNSSRWDPSRIDRFEVTPNGTITHKGLAFRWTAADAGVSSLCGLDLNDCVMVEGVFSPDGSRLYAREDADDYMVFFNVNLTTGALTPTVQYTAMNQYDWGMVLNPTDPGILYTGWMAWDVSAGTPALLNALDSPRGGNGTQVRNIGGTDMLLTSDESNGAASFLSLAAPQAPALWATSVSVSNGFHDILFQDGTSRILSFGKNAIRSWDTSLTGPGSSTITANSTFTPSLGGGGVTFQYVMHRRAIFWPVPNGADDQTRVLSPWFARDTGNTSWYGGLSTLSIGSGGAITETANVALGGPARSIVSLER